MANAKFKVGDKVKHTGGDYKGIVTDLSGHNGEKEYIRVKRDDGVDGSGNGTGKYAVSPEGIKLIKRNVKHPLRKPITSSSLRLYE